MGSTQAGGSSGYRVPATKRNDYFCGANDKFSLNWIELLCCPSATGCTIVIFNERNQSGGEAQYKVVPRLSHNENVPRYQLLVVKDGQTKQWNVGHMYKTETHIRAEPGEFVKVQAWNLTCNEMEWVERRDSLHRQNSFLGKAVQPRPTPKASGSKTIGMTIATQARVNYDKLDDDNHHQACWIQSLAVSEKTYKLTIEKPRTMSRGGHDGFHPSMESMDVMRILHHNKKVCVARKQIFGGTLGGPCRPFLGVRIYPGFEQKGEHRPPQLKAGSAGATPPPDPPRLTSLLDTSGLMLLLLCLAWSEETMNPSAGSTSKFVEMMQEEPENIQDATLNAGRLATETASRLRHIDYAKLHSWDSEAGGFGRQPSPNSDPSKSPDQRGSGKHRVNFGEEDEYHESLGDTGAGVGGVDE